MRAGARKADGGGRRKNARMTRAVIVASRDGVAQVSDYSDFPGRASQGFKSIRNQEWTTANSENML